ncbi:hypothetical protein CEXT_333111 [Caerostris extrusa]|uniref:Uncharacterized protein n=1 Tax=Caerostris extrusa TaxID=172846 RepID=A0AAV4Y689_CAEEX|nr:hypothetical protein CEXT_333111 [Caerostris extrusa]
MSKRFESGACKRKKKKLQEYEAKKPTPITAYMHVPTSTTQLEAMQHVELKGIAIRNRSSRGYFHRTGVIDVFRAPYPLNLRRISVVVSHLEWCNRSVMASRSDFPCDTPSTILRPDVNKRLPKYFPASIMSGKAYRRKLLKKKKPISTLNRQTRQKVWISIPNFILIIPYVQVAVCDRLSP